MTKAERLFTLLGEVDAELIEEAAAPAPRGTVIHWKRWAAVAACAALILTAPHLMPRMGSSEAPENNAAPEARPPQSAEDKDYGDKADPTDPAGSANENTPLEQETPTVNGLPVLSESSQFSEGLGTPGIWIDNISDYRGDGLIYDGAPPDTLPVYLETSPFGLTGDAAGVISDETAMQTRLEEILSRFSFNPAECTIEQLNCLKNKRTEGEPLAYLKADLPDGSTVWIRYDLNVTVLLSTENCSARIQSPDHSSLAGMDTFGAAVVEELSWLFDMSHPYAAVTGGDVNLYGETLCYLEIRDTGDYLSALTGETATGFGLSNGRLVIQLNPRYGREHLGDYPIITPEEAKAQLLTGTWPGYQARIHKIPSEEQILRCSLVYCTNVDGYTMPYYQFCLDFGDVLTLENRANGTTSGETVSMLEFYYVPAVEKQYFEGYAILYDLTSNALTVYTPTAEGWQTTEVVERAAKRVCTVLTICEPEPAETHEDALTAWLDLGNGTVVGLYSADYAVVYTCEGDFDPDDTAALTPHIEGIFYDLDATLAAALENPTETWDDSEALAAGDLDEETPILSPSSPEGNS